MKFLYKTFIKDYKNTKDNKVRARYGIFAGIVGISLNVILVILKIVIGILANSISIIGDAINNLGDTMSSIINVFSFKINDKPADKKHPYGHRRSEYIGGLLISILIIVVAVELATSGIDKIINPTPTSITWALLVVLIVNIAIKSFMSILYHHSAKTINSLSLLACYKDSLNDILTTCIIIIGLYISKYFGFDLDGYLAIALAIFIVASVIKLIKESIDKLLGESFNDEIVKQIEKEILKEKEILGLHSFMAHQYGEGKVFMSVHVEMDASNSLIKAHNIVDRIERNIKRKYDINMLIHIDPIDFKDKELMKMKSVISDILNQIDTNLSSHDVRIVIGKYRRIYFDLVMPYSYQSRSKEIVDIVIGEIARKTQYKSSIEINYK